jgi:hypothetical protein
MQLLLRDPDYTTRLATFLKSLGQHPVVAAPNELELENHADETSLLEMEIYLRVWRVLYPEAEVEVA